MIEARWVRWRAGGHEVSGGASREPASASATRSNDLGFLPRRRERLGEVV